jgi:hypothetical protein
VRSPQLPPVASLGLQAGGFPLSCVGMATVSWASLVDEDDGIDEELVPMTPPATQTASLAAHPAPSCVSREAEVCDGWKEVFPRRGSGRPASPTPALPPRPIPAWFSGRCCRCLAHGNRATVCKDPFQCSHCLKNGHRARECCNPWRPLNSLSCLTTPQVSGHDVDRRHALMDTNYLILHLPTF